MSSGYRRPTDAAALATNFRVFATADCASEPLYAALSVAIAEQSDTLALLMQAPYAQRRPVLLFAAVHDLLLAGSTHPLAAFYRTVAGAAVRKDVEHAGAAFDDFCRACQDPLLALLRIRNVQTNEVGRCAGLRLALSTLDAGSAPLALIDVGCSAGLNLLVDHYRFEWALPDGGSCSAGPPGEVVVRSRLRGSDAVRAAAPVPEIASRQGIDVAPLDVRDERDARWLQACVWPGDDDRHVRLAAAMSLARDAALDVRRGEAVERLEAVVATLDPTMRPVVFHSWVVSYFEHAARRRFVEMVRALVVARDGVWVSAEAPDVVPGLTPPPLPPDADGPLREATVWHLTTRVRGEASSRAVARSHPHCRWIHWLDAPTA